MRTDGQHQHDDATNCQEPYHLTRHAARQLQRRNLTDADLDYVLAHGVRLRRTGIIFVVLRRRDIPVADLRGARAAKLEGVIVLVSHDRVIITAYRNRQGLRTILKKHKGSLRPPRAEARRYPFQRRWAAV
jgi:hypothetical protein